MDKAYKAILIFLLISPVSADQFIFGTIGAGYYSRSMGDPEIRTPNGLGSIELGFGHQFDNNVEVTISAEHWSSLQGFPNVFSSPDEDGEGFNAVWIKASKRIYQ